MSWTRAAVVALATTSLTGPSCTLRAGDATETAIRTVLEREADAFRKGDLAGVTACWETEETSSVIESGEANWGWADYREHHLKPELAGMKLAAYERTNLRVVLGGDMALVTLEFRIAGSYKGRPFDSTGLESVVLRRKDGTWRIVHVHSSAHPKKTTAK